MAILLGWPKILVGLMVAFFLGSMVGVTLLLMGKVKRRSTLPFGPFLVVGTVVALIWGQQLINLFF